MCYQAWLLPLTDQVAVAGQAHDQSYHSLLAGVQSQMTSFHMFIDNEGPDLLAVVLAQGLKALAVPCQEGLLGQAVFAVCCFACLRVDPNLQPSLVCSANFYSGSSEIRHLAIMLESSLAQLGQDHYIVFVVSIEAIHDCTPPIPRPAPAGEFCLACACAAQQACTHLASQQSAAG